MPKKERYPDPLYGGVHVGSKEARRAIPRGCPPTEIFVSYLGGKQRSFLTRTEITDDIIKKIRRHLPECRMCGKLLLILHYDK